MRKNVPNTFESNPDLARTLRGLRIDDVVIAGMQSEYCISATSLTALGEGFTVQLVSGAHATYDDVTFTD